MKFIFLIIAAYLLGSVPFGQIIAKAHGKDLRKIGSGNIGATNLARAVGRRWAWFCFVLDLAKGLLPTLAAAKAVSSSPSPVEFGLWLATGCAAIAGHVFPVYMKFRGGKGVATSFGVAMGIWPYYTICAGISFAVWLIVVLVSRYVSLGSIIAAICFPAALIAVTFFNDDWMFADLWPLFIAAIVLPAAVIFLHRANIKRIAAGTEHKIFSPKQL